MLHGLALLLSSLVLGGRPAHGAALPHFVTLPDIVFTRLAPTDAPGDLGGRKSRALKTSISQY